MATSPELLGGFLRLTPSFEQLTLGALEREVAAVAFAVEVGCHHCVAMHVGALRRLGGDGELILALRNGGPIADERLAALRDFVRAVVAERGAVEPELRERFLGHGFTPRQALEVVFMVGALSMSSYASRLMDVPLDTPLRAAS